MAVPILTSAFALREGLPVEEKMVSKLRLALVSALVSLVLVAPGLLAYDGEVAKQVDVSGPRSVVCPTIVSVTATVVDLNGNPLAGVEVVWSTGAVGTTNASGQHTISVNVTADVTVTATAGGAVGSLVISCVQQGVPLPRTDTALAAEPGAPAAWWAYLLVALVVPGVLVLAARRR
jgi:hypothetical protein